MEKRRNKILEIHAGWLWNQDMFEKSMECLEQAKEVRSENKGYKYVNTTNGVGTTERVSRS